MTEDLALRGAVTDDVVVQIFGGRRGLTNLSRALLDPRPVSAWSLGGVACAEDTPYGASIEELTIEDSEEKVSLLHQSSRLTVRGSIQFRRFMAASILELSLVEYREHPLAHLDFNVGADGHFYAANRVDLTVALCSPDFV